MVFYNILFLTVIIYLILNFSKVCKGKFGIRDLILPFSLSFAVIIASDFLKTAIVASILAFVVLFAVCFGFLHYVASLKR
jgi:hypothetical protein